MMLEVVGYESEFAQYFFELCYLNIIYVTTFDTTKILQRK